MALVLWPRLGCTYGIYAIKASEHQPICFNAHIYSWSNIIFGTCPPAKAVLKHSPIGLEFPGELSALLEPNPDPQRSTLVQLASSWAKAGDLNLLDSEPCFAEWLRAAQLGIVL